MIIPRHQKLNLIISAKEIHKPENLKIMKLSFRESDRGKTQKYPLTTDLYLTGGSVDTV